MPIIGYIAGIPIYETRTIVHDPSNGQFTSGSGGGSAIGHAPKLLSKAVVHQINQLDDLSNTGLRGHRDEALHGLGHSKETIEKVDWLIKSHIHGSAQQVNAGMQIKAHLDSNDHVGRAIHDLTKLENEAWHVWTANAGNRVDRRIAAERKEIIDDIKDLGSSPRKGFKKLTRDSIHNGDLDKKLDELKHIYLKKESGELYRKSNDGERRLVESWSTDSKGAKFQISVDHRGKPIYDRATPNMKTELNKANHEGYSILNGVLSNRGEAGEAEITLLKIKHR